MHGSRFALAISLLASSAVPAQGDTPPVGQSYFSAPCIRLVNVDAGGVPSAAGAFTVFVRDLANQPVPFSQVQLEFDACMAPHDVFVQAVQPQAGVTLDCAMHVVRLTADEHGQATFHVVGGSRNLLGGAPSALPSCVRIRADGVILGTVSVAAFDQNGTGGLTPADIGSALADLLSGLNPRRSDFDCNTLVSPADLGLLVSQLLRGTTLPLSGAFCDP